MRHVALQAYADGFGIAWRAVGLCNGHACPPGYFRL